MYKKNTTPNIVTEKTIISTVFSIFFNYEDWLIDYYYGETFGVLDLIGKYACSRISWPMESIMCWPIVFPVVCITILLATVVTPDCSNEAVLKPDNAGPTSANGPIKHPDNVTLNVTIKSNLLIIESPQCLIILYIFYDIIKSNINLLICKKYNL